MINFNLTLMLIGALVALIGMKCCSGNPQAVYRSMQQNYVINIKSTFNIVDNDTEKTKVKPKNQKICLYDAIFIKHLKTH